jgi:hypothetical protein
MPPGLGLLGGVWESGLTTPHKLQAEARLGKPVPAEVGCLSP